MLWGKRITVHGLISQLIVRHFDYTSSSSCCSLKYNDNWKETEDI